MLPEGLPDDWRVTPLGPDHTDAAFALLEADRTRFLGFNPLTRDTVGSTLEPRGSRRQVLGVWAAGRLELGAMTLTDDSVTQGVLHVSELAVRADWRRRGVATALLAAAFDLARSQGLATMRLFADSESTSGAPRLYRDLGLEVRSASAQYERPLGAG